MSTPVRISLITVTYNAAGFLPTFCQSLAELNLHGIELEIIAVDNGSTDGTQELLGSRFPQIRLLINTENNYAGALNTAIESSEGDFVVIANNDATFDRSWLQGLLSGFDYSERVGAVQSKIFFSEKNLLNSVGVTEVEHWYFADIGFEEEDSGQYAQPEARDYVTGGSVMFRRACLDDVGPWDEEFIMFMEDVDYSARCRAKGWQLRYSPDSVMFHRYHGSTSDSLCEYFCTRNRFFFVAKHHPTELIDCIPSSHFYRKDEHDALYRSLLHATRMLCRYHDEDTVIEVLGKLAKSLPKYLGDVSTYNFFSQLELLLGLRSIRVGIYDHAGHFAGGGQRYVAEMASIMLERYDVTYIFNNDVSLDDYREWFDLDLSAAKMKVIRLPFFDQRQRFTPDEGMVIDEKYNVFDVISRESLNYDVFVNANMLGKVNPLALASVFVCHFPDQEKHHYSHVDKYDHLMINGDYTGEWVRKRWGLQATDKLYPPINMYNSASSADRKDKLILSVSRFEVSGSKKQAELIQAFSKLCREHPQQMQGWKLILVGGSTPENDYLDYISELVDKHECLIELCVNARVEQIRELYARAALFWHACGLAETKPELVEHFGMTTVESMQNFCVPIVIDGGGQREIVEQGKSGYRFSSIDQLCDYSLELITDESQRRNMAECAFERSHLFDHTVFRSKLEAMLDDLEAELLGRERLP